MKRFRLVAVAAVVIGALAPSPRAGAQVGPWSEQFPAWVDLNGNGAADAGERTLYPEAVWNDQLDTSDPDYLYVVLKGNPWDACQGHLESRYNVTPLLNPQTVSRRRGDRTQTVSGTLPSFTFLETKYVFDVPASVGRAARRVRVLEEVPRANGSAAFFDPNGDGQYDGLSVGGTKGQDSVPQTDLDFTYRDVNGDGKNDYVSLPWALTGVLGVKTSNDCVGGSGGAPQVWMPLHDSNGDGLPDTVSVRFPDPRDPEASGGLDGPPLNAAVGAGRVIPAASTAGLVAFAAALVAAGASLLRATGGGAGA